MQSAVLTDSNKEQMMEAHENTFTIRKAWIDDKKKKPSGMEIVERFPRFMDMLKTVWKKCLPFFKYLFLSVSLSQISFDFEKRTGASVDNFINKWLTIEAKISTLLPIELRDEINNTGIEKLFVPLLILYPNMYFFNFREASCEKPTYIFRTTTTIASRYRKM